MASHSAHDIAAEIRKRIPGVPVKKLHKLLYYCQGYHVATFDEPLFDETVSAWDMGPVVGQLWWAERQGYVSPGAGTDALAEGELNTIGYVVSRYGRLSGMDLERLTHSEPPWIDANSLRQDRGEDSHKIPLNALRAFFSAEDESDDGSEPPLDPSSVQALLAGAPARLKDDLQSDTPDSILARLPA